MAKVITTDAQAFQAFTQATQHAQSRAQAAEAERAATEAARLALPTQVQAITGPAVQAAQSAASLAVQRAGVVGSVANDAALAGRAAGDYRIGTEIVSWNGNAVTARTAVLAAATDVQEARAVADSASNALSNLTLAALAARAQADGPQIVDGSRWTWEATGVPDGGTVVAALGGGYWHREFVGPVYATWFGCAADGVTLDDEPMGRAARAAIGYRAALDLDDLSYVLLQVELTAGLTVQNGRILSDVTGGGTSVRAPFYFNGQDASAGKTRATMEAKRIYDIVFRDVEFDGRRNLHTNITGFGDGARALVAVWGRASRILFDSDLAPG